MSPVNVIVARDLQKGCFEILRPLLPLRVGKGPREDIKEKDSVCRGLFTSGVTPPPREGVCEAPTYHLAPGEIGFKGTSHGGWGTQWTPPERSKTCGTGAG